jgi:hypothetical protein
VVTQAAHGELGSSVKAFFAAAQLLVRLLLDGDATPQDLWVTLSTALTSSDT